MMRHRMAAAALAGLTLAGLASPAGAVKPDVTMTPITWQDMDPCTGEMHEFTGMAVVRTIVNRNVTLQFLDVEGSTDSGYVAGGAPIRSMVFDDGGHHLVSQTFRNPESRRAFHVRVRYMVKDMTPTMDFFDIRCLTGETIYWPEG